MLKIFKILAAVSLFIPFSINAAAIFNLIEEDGNVILTGEGTLNLNGLVASDLPGLRTGGTDPFINPSFSVFGTGGSESTNIIEYLGVNGPTNFGAGTAKRADSGTGDVFGITVDFDTSTMLGLIIFENYTSGDFISGSGVWEGESFSSMGVDVGVYIWSWDTDSVTLNIGLVPLPVSFWLLFSSFIFIKPKIKPNNSLKRDALKRAP